MSLFAPDDDLQLTRKTDILLPTLKFVDLRDGMQAGDCAVNSVSEALEILIILAAFAHAYKGGSQFEVGFAGSSELGVGISRAAAEFLAKIGMGDRANLFARTMHYKSASPESDENIVKAVTEARDAGITSMTFVSKATPRQTRESFNLDTPELHIEQVGKSFAYAREQGITDLTLDPEHSFEAMRSESAEDREFFMRMCMAAYEGGCRKIVLCDTNGETTPEEIKQSLLWLHSIGGKITDADFGQRWHKMMTEMQWGLHLHDDSTYALASTMSAIDTDHLGHVDMTFIESGERGGGNNQFLKWACQMFQERGINVFGENEEVWGYMVACAHRVSHIMHRRNLRTREHRLGRLASAQTAGMHTVVQKRSGTLYRPDAHGQKRSVLDLLKQIEVFSLNRQAGGQNIKHNMCAMGFEDAAGIELRAKECEKAINHNLDGENGDICYSTHKASAALKFWQVLNSGQYDANILKIAEVRVEAAVKGDGDGRVSSRITFDDEAGGAHDWFEIVSDQGILDAQFRALMKGLKKENTPVFREVETVEIVDYHQDAIGTGANARVITSMTMIDTKTRETWAVSCVRESSFNSAYECMKDGLRYWIAVQKKYLRHYQDPGLEFMYRYSREDLISRLYQAVGMDEKIPLEFLQKLEKSA